ncbi:MAG: glycosyltransferase family 9 protein [Bacteroidota bacterium]
MKFLIIRFSSIGDIVLTTPVIRCLKNQIKNSEVHYLTKKSFSSVLKNNPYVDKFHFIESSVKENIDSLREEKFDFIIDLHNNLRSFQVKKFLGVKSYSFRKLNFKKWILVNFKMNRMPPVHIVDRYMNTVKEFSIENDGAGLDFFLDSGSESILNLLPEYFNRGFYALVLGGTYFTKQIPQKKLYEICSKSNLPLVLLGGSSEISSAQDLSEKFDNKVFNVCGKLSLNESAALIYQSKKVFTSDTGLMHIASAFKKQIISFWGNTVPEFGMSPYLPVANSIILENKNIKCRPCSKLGYHQCPKGHFKCMNDLVISQNLFD